MDWQIDLPVAKNAAAQLPALVVPYFEAGRKAFGPHPSPEVLHRFRIETKRFRYSLELFQHVYGPGLRRLLEALRRLQQSLGDINDCAAVRVLLERHSAPPALVAYLDSRMERKLAEALALWRTDFAPAGEEKRWAAYLRRYAGTGSGAVK